MTSAADLWLDVLAWQSIASAFSLALRDDSGEYLATVSGNRVTGLCEARRQYTAFDTQRGRLNQQMQRVGRADRKDGSYWYSIRTLEGVRRRVDLCLRCAAAVERAHRRAQLREERQAQ